MATEGFGQRLCVSRCWFILMPGVTVHTRAFPSAAAQHWPPVGLHYSLAPLAPPGDLAYPHLILKTAGLAGFFSTLIPRTPPYFISCTTIV